jgi:hypothetical protein
LLIFISLEQYLAFCHYAFLKFIVMLNILLLVRHSDTTLLNLLQPLNILNCRNFLSLLLKKRVKILVIEKLVLIPVLAFNTTEMAVILRTCGFALLISVQVTDFM